MSKITNHEVLCPNCGGNNLHHHTVLVFSRDHEDAETGTFALVNKTKVEVKTVPMYENPSDRRDGLRILFDCENCNYILEMSLAQHKGVTLLSTDVYDEK